MRIVKRILAGFLAVSVLFSSNMICFTAIAEETNDTNITMPDSNVTEGDFELTIDIPEQWSNDIKKWTITTDDADLFYKISDDIIDEKEWGSYTDDDIKKWNDGEDFDEGEGYIKFWAVKEVNGEAIPSGMEKQPFIAFDVKKKTIHGNAGCNLINGGFETSTSNAKSISFPGVASTMMACPDMETEGKVLKAINEVKSFDVLSGGGIGLYDANGALVIVLEK